MPKFTPTEFISVVNQTLEYAYSNALIEGEVSSFKVNQGKWVFFDLKDTESSIGCFMSVWSLRTPLEDGMKVVVRGVPKLTKWGKFSFTVETVQPVGEGSLKKAFELLKKKLLSEGLFDPAKKRAIPEGLTKIGVISSTEAAGYKDFIKIVNARWGGLKIQVAHTQVQGLDAPDQMIRALNYFNEKSEVELIVMIRGGGSADDLACYNDEALVRAIAASKIPVATGIGHEIDESLADLAADFRASTPSNLAELITPSRQEAVKNVKKIVSQMGTVFAKNIDDLIAACRTKVEGVRAQIELSLDKIENELRQKIRIIETMNPEKVLKQGYAILRGKISPGNVVKITTYKQEINAEIKEIYERKS